MVGFLINFMMWVVECRAEESPGQLRTRCSKPITLDHLPRHQASDLGLSMERRFMLHSRACSPWYTYV